MSKSKALTAAKPRKDYKLLYYAIPFMIIVLLFNYVPIFGWIYAFFDYVPGVKLNDSEFVGLEYFKLIFTDANVWRSLGNTFIFAILGILFSPLPMFFAILLNEVKNGPVRKIVQTFTTLPNFISWVIIFSLAFTLFSSDGLITTLLLKIGIGTEGQNLLGDGNAVYIFQSLLGLWKGLGWSSIIYLAAIAGIDQEQYEAAKVDGAGYFRCALHITMPAMIGTFVVLFILNIGNFLNTGYEQYLLFKNSLTADNIEVLDLYAYRIGLENMDYSYGVAISIIKSVVSVVLVTFANLVAKKMRGSAVVEEEIMNNHIKSSASRRVFQVFNYIFLLFITFICIYPFWYVVIYTLSDPSKAGEVPPVLIPSGFSLENYKQILTLNGFLPSLGISFARTVAGTVLSVGSCSFLGYLFSKENMPFRKFLYRFLILTMYISGGMIATYIVIKSYGLLNTFWVYIIPGMISAYNVVLIKTYVESLPASLEESAKLDGAGVLTIFTKIIFPLSKPIIATVAVFVAVGQWNSWFDNHIYTRGVEELKTLQYLLYNYLNEAQRIAEQLRNATSSADASVLMQEISSKGIRMSITVLAALPIFLFYPFMQKYFVKGIMVGAVKG